MNRTDLKRLLVLTEIADDYETPEHIYWNVAEKANLCGLAIQPAEVLRILVDLIQSGEAKAYRLTPTASPAEEIQGVPPFDSLRYLYFWITEKGLEVLSLAGEWPFDGEGDLLPGWTAPAE